MRTSVHPCTRWKPHLHTLVLAQAVDDFDDEVLGNLEVLQADAFRAVQHEEEVDGPAGALCSRAQDLNLLFHGCFLCELHVLPGSRAKASS